MVLCPILRALNEPALGTTVARMRKVKQESAMAAYQGSECAMRDRQGYLLFHNGSLGLPLAQRCLYN